MERNNAIVIDKVGTKAPLWVSFVEPVTVVNVLGPVDSFGEVIDVVGIVVVLLDGFVEVVVDPNECFAANSVIQGTYLEILA